MLDLVRLLSADFFSGKIVGELRFSKLTSRRVLNAPGNITTTLADFAGNEACETAENPNMLKPIRRMLVVERLGQIQNAGIIMTPQGEVQSSVDVGALGVWEAIKHRVVRNNLIYQAKPSLDIVRDLVRYTQGTASLGGSAGDSRGNFGLSVDAIGTGPVSPNRDEYYFSYERKNIGQAVESLSQLESGFDFTIDLGWGDFNHTVLSKTFRVGYPMIGQYRPTYWHLDGQFGKGTKVQVDATKYRNSSHVTGAGDGEAMLISVAEDTGQLSYAGDANGYDRVPLWEEVASFRDEWYQPNLDARSLADLHCFSKPNVIPTLKMVSRREVDGDNSTIYNGPDSFDPGDVLHLESGAAGGWAQFNGWYRAMDQTVTWTENGTEETSATIVPWPAP